MARRSYYRTIRNGRVRINGRFYKPDDRHVSYDGRLDGHRYLFLGYPNRPEIMALWGSEAAAVEKNEQRFTELMHTTPEIVDGHLPWYFWKTDMEARL